MFDLVLHWLGVFLGSLLNPFSVLRLGFLPDPKDNEHPSITK